MALTDNGTGMIQLPYMKQGEQKIYYETSGNGTPIVFVHPPAMGHLTFRYQRPLAHHFQLIFIDLVGSGRSTNRTSATAVSDFAEIVYQLITKLQLKKIVLCGYSNGGSIAQEFALRYPDLTLGIILIGGFSEVSTFILKKEFQLGVWVARKQMIPLFSYVLPLAHFKTRTHRIDMAKQINLVNHQTLQSIYQKGLLYTSTERLKSLDVPLLLLYGQYDLYLRSYLYLFFKYVKDVEAVLVSGVSHQIPTRRPHECNQIIREWVRRKNLT